MAKTVAIRLDENFQERLRQIGEREERSPHYLMKRAVEEFIERSEWERSEHEITMQRWNDYLETGIAIPHEEVMKNIRALIKSKT
ncbi:CopG family ribbon-helix-helix protein [Robiginitomaculum antarcticum]|uniref:CopG family ribbon-helix-helix protein n=1 Tax=Robiginitomaculum antarcticum TaxID=437507 RepID=UPI000366A7C1|nr:ribbon-helix-helix protein, CopG family [Robiginitomaculum antarcticum]